ncbi:MAG TPA: transporter substrate-binding domain-containing protein [Bacteroidales bacterium]|nr:transporter substrate-binding domain-containing protein [Bacteroidales bacterium]
MGKKLHLLSIMVLFIVLTTSCWHIDNDSAVQLEPDSLMPALDRVAAEGRLRVLTSYSAINYYIYRGEPVGYQYEMLKSLASSLGVKLELSVERNIDEAFEKLAAGKAHLLAMDLTVTASRMKEFDFTEPIFITRQVLVQRLPRNWQLMQTRNELENQMIRSSLELAGKTIHVQSGTIHRKRLEVLADEIGDTIIIVDDDREPEALIKAVSKGEIPLAVVDEHIAMAFIRDYPNIDIKTPLSFQQKVAWAVRKEDEKSLLQELNEWLGSFMASSESRVLYDKYFGQGFRQKLRSEYHSFNEGKLSPFDDIIREVAVEIGWDWRLLASLIYQESEFKPSVVSWAGAFGLMQLMPPVMELYGIDQTATPEQQIRVGGKYILYLDRQIPESITDPNERIRFVLASYNSGVGHVLDARRLAAKYNKNPDLWTDNVDFFMRNKSRPAFFNDPVSYYGYVRGEETYLFVEQIMERFEHYKNLLPEKKKR